MDRHKEIHPCVLQDIGLLGPFGAAAKKRKTLIGKIRKNQMVFFYLFVCIGAGMQPWIYEKKTVVKLLLRDILLQ